MSASKIAVKTIALDANTVGRALDEKKGAAMRLSLVLDSIEHIVSVEIAGKGTFAPLVRTIGEKTPSHNQKHRFQTSVANFKGREKDAAIAAFSKVAAGKSEVAAAGEDAQSVHDRIVGEVRELVADMLAPKARAPKPEKTEEQKVNEALEYLSGQTAAFTADQWMTIVQLAAKAPKIEAPKGKGKQRANEAETVQA